MNAGWLHDDVVAAHTSSIKRRLDTAQTEHATADTPYGPVCQEMDLEVVGFRLWRYCHLLAYMYYLSKISTSFADLMMSSNTDGTPNRLIIYIDEVCPGNPLRPEKSRTLQAIYWAFAEWPQHVLQRTAAWPVFGTLRSTIADKVPGGVAGLMTKVLAVFFAAAGPSFANGVHICKGPTTRLITAVFGGFLMDEKAHNQVFGSKGASGTKCCMTCKNCYNRVSDEAINEIEGAIGIAVSGILQSSTSTPTIRFMQRTTPLQLQISENRQSSANSSVSS